MYTFVCGVIYIYIYNIVMSARDKYEKECYRDESEKLSNVKITINLEIIYGFSFHEQFKNIR